ncbi:MAG: O-antigen ligase family protein [Thiohalocapsa sp.]
MSAWTDRVQGFGLYITALSVFLAPAGVSIGLGLIWLGFFMSLATGRRRLPSSSGVWLALAFVAYVLADGVFRQASGVAAAGRLESVAEWVQLGVFVPVAYALRGDQHRLLQLLRLALIGLVLGVLWRLDWSLLFSDSARFLKSRPGFGFPAIVFALFAGVALVGLLVLRERWWTAGASRTAGWPVLVWLVVTTFVAQAFVLTLSRGAWVALVGTAVTAFWMNLRGLGAQAATPTRRSPLLLAAGVLLTGLLVFNSGPMVDRLVEERAAVGAMLSGQLDYSSESSLSLRWHAQLFGLQQWLERPMFGWGAGASRALMKTSGNPALLDQGVLLKHLHNTYLEILVQLGLVGLLLWIGIFVSLLMSVASAWRNGALSPDLARFLILSIVYLAIWDLFDFHALHQGWRGHWAMLAGAALSVGLFAKVARSGLDDAREEGACASP